MSSHLTFNSLTQYSHHYLSAHEANPGLKFGIRINPEYSEVGTDIYNPCAPGTRFGVLSNQMPEKLPEGITGFHCHCHRREILSMVRPDRMDKLWRRTSHDSEGL